MNLLELILGEKQPEKNIDKKAYLIVNNYPYPLKQEVIEELTEIGAPIIWVEKEGNISVE